MAETSQYSDEDSMESMDIQLDDENLCDEATGSGLQFEQPQLVTDSSGHEDKPPQMGEIGKMSSILRPRGYQLEMLEKSLERNIIVAVRLIGLLL